MCLPEEVCRLQFSLSEYRPSDQENRWLARGIPSFREPRLITEGKATALPVRSDLLYLVVKLIGLWLLNHQKDRQPFRSCDFNFCVTSNFLEVFSLKTQFFQVIEALKS